MKKEKQQIGQNFSGFSLKIERGEFWQYPTIMDNYWYSLSGSEQKVLDYILRRTYGFQKIKDAISISQLKNGITKRTGEKIDNGTGLKQDSTILKALKSLEKKGFIISEKRKNKTTTYKLKIKLLYKIQKSPIRNKEVGSVKNTDTINSNTIDSLQNAYIKKLKPYKKPFYMGSHMRYKDQGDKWFVINDEEWREFTGKWKDVIWE